MMGVESCLAKAKIVDEVMMMGLVMVVVAVVMRR